MWLAWALAAVGLPAFALPGPLDPTYGNALRHYGDAEGLPQVSVNAIVQSRDGFLWLGTFGGLVRFDGRDFRVYGSVDHVHGGDHGLGPASNRILSLHEDRQGRLWIGTQDAGISLLERGRFRHLRLCEGRCQIDRLLPVDARTLWAQGAQGIYRIDMRSLQAERFLGARALLASAHLPGEDTVYAGGDNGLWRLGPQGVAPVRLPDGRTVRHLAASPGLLWLVTHDRMLYRHRPATGEWTRVRSALPLDTRLGTAGDGRVFLSDDVHGLRMLDDAGREHPVPGASTLHAATVHPDGLGNTWIGTPTHGLWRLRPRDVAMLHAPGFGGRAPGRVVEDDGRGGLWLGFGCEGLWYRAPSGEVTRLPLEDAMQDACTASLFYDAAQATLWIGSSNGGLGRLRDGRLELAWQWPGAKMLGIWRSRDGTWWAGSSQGVRRLDIDADGTVQAAHAIPGVADVNVARLADAHAGGIWVVGDRGVFRVRDDVVVEQWTASDGLPAFARAVHDGEDGLWVGTYGGGLVHIHQGRMRRYTTADGLSDDTVSCILTDRRGRFWMAGNAGLSVLLERPIDASGPRLRTIGAAEGLDPVEFNGVTFSACHIDAQGNKAFAMMRGFGWVEPGRLDVAARHPPRPYVDRVTLSGRPLDPYALPTLGVDAANLEIVVGVIGLADPERTRMRYRVGEGAEWVDADAGRSVLLPDVPWGELRFEAQARYFDGGWSEPVTLRFLRPIPWYRRDWIWLAASLAGLLCLLWATRERRGEDGDYDALIERARARLQDGRTLG